MTAAELKLLFSIGDRPNEEGFADLIDEIYRRRPVSVTETVEIITSEITITEDFVDEIDIDTTDASDLETITAAIGSEYDFILRNSTGGDVTITSADNIDYDGVLRDGEFIYLTLSAGAVTLNPIMQLINQNKGVEYNVQTTDAVQTSAGVLSLPLGFTGHYKVKAIATYEDGGGDDACIVFEGSVVAKSTAIDVSVVADNVAAIYEDDADTDIIFSTGSVTQTIPVDVVGIAGTVINWRINIQPFTLAFP